MSEFDSGDYINRVVMFNDGLEHKDYSTIPFDPGMKARIEEITLVRDNIIQVKLDFSEFIRHNSNCMQRNWGDRMFTKCKKWNETKFYPSDHKLTVLVYTDNLPFELS
jgi:hypothetical protein